MDSHFTEEGLVDVSIVYAEEATLQHGTMRTISGRTSSRTPSRGRGRGRGRRGQSASIPSTSQTLPTQMGHADDIGQRLRDAEAGVAAAELRATTLEAEAVDLRQRLDESTRQILEFTEWHAAHFWDG